MTFRDDRHFNLVARFKSGLPSKVYGIPLFILIYQTCSCFEQTTNRRLLHRLGLADEAWLEFF